MKIGSIETFSIEFVGFVRVTADDGAEGRGQILTYNSDISSQILHRQVAPWALVHDIYNVDALADLVAEREHKFPGS